MHTLILLISKRRSGRRRGLPLVRDTALLPHSLARQAHRKSQVPNSPVWARRPLPFATARYWQFDASYNAGVPIKRLRSRSSLPQMMVAYGGPWNSRGCQRSVGWIEIRMLENNWLYTQIRVGATFQRGTVIELTRDSRRRSTALVGVVPLTTT